MLLDYKKCFNKKNNQLFKQIKKCQTFKKEIQKN